MAVDDAVTDRYKDITPKECFAASATFITAAVGIRSKDDEEDEEE